MVAGFVLHKATYLSVFACTLIHSSSVQGFTGGAGACPSNRREKGEREPC